MGLLDNLFETVTSTEVGQSLINGAISVLENANSEKRIIKNSTAEYRLKIKRKKNSYNLTVYDEYDNRKFEIKQVLLNIGQPRIDLYDADKNKVGYVKREKDWFSSYYSYAVYAGNKHLTTVDHMSSFKLRYDIGLNGWEMESNLLQSCYTVKDPKENQIIKINSTTEDRGLFIVEYNGKDNELISVFIFMVTILMSRDLCYK
ncbi:MAG: hypothetical protein NC427_02690 [Ruminococcus flavefaciens]|nr:hypothetical protein [Ruminococcus flavefaciens]